MDRTTREIIRIGVFALLCVLIAAAWIVYAHSPGLQVHFAHLSRDLEPLYAIARDPFHPSPYTHPVSLTSSPGFGRLCLAIGVSIGALGLIGVGLARRWATWLCLGVAVVAVFGINVSIARIPMGYDSLVEPMTRRNLEYWPEVAKVNDDPVRFVQQYPMMSPFMGVHPGTHPPGAIVFLWASGKTVDAVVDWTAPARHKLFGAPATKPTKPKNPFGFLFGERPEPPPLSIGKRADTAAWVAIGVTALGVVPAYWLATLVGGTATARRLLPLYAAAPNLVIYGATSMDGVFLTCATTALAAGVWAIQKRSFFRPLVAGAALWVGCFMTYTLVMVPALLGLYSLCTMIRRPGRGEAMLGRCAFVGVAFVLVQLEAQRRWGFDFMATAQAAIMRDTHAMGVRGNESTELWWKLSAGNLLAWLFGSGVAAIALVAMALPRMFRRRPLAPFTLALVVCSLGMAVSTLFTLETERVWLLLTPPLLVAATAHFRGLYIWILALVGLVAQAIWIEVNYRTYW